MQIRCPHCLSPFESAVDVSCDDMVCPSCGMDFSLASEKTTNAYSPGVRVLGRFELLQQVGSGSFGSVWKARDTELQRIVALKVPRRGQLDRHETELFLRDARAAAQLRHPRIASVHEVGRDDETVYIVTDFIDGANLAEWLSGKRLSSREAAELMARIADAVHHAHEAGVVHRDLKPSNIMLDHEGEPYVIDFGLARREVGEMTYTVEGQLLGTPTYMSPEQARGEGHHADRRSDVYSLGVILFTLLTGELPFRGQARMLLVQILDEEPPSPRKLNADVPRDLETIALKCLEKDPAKRYQTARELSDDLRRYIDGKPIRARPIGPIERAWRWCKRYPAVASLSALLLLLLVAVSVVAPIVALREARLRRESELQAANNLFQRACEEYNDGRVSAGIALLSAAYDPVGQEDTLSGSIRGLMSGWSAQCGRPIVQDKPILAVGLSADGKKALLGGHDLEATARLWNVTSLTPLGGPLQHENSVRAVAFNPAANTALTGSQDSTARLWDIATGAPVGAPLQHEEAVWAVAFSPDGAIAATGSHDDTARLWNVETGAPLGEPLKHSDNVLAVAFSPDGRTVVTGCLDGSAQVWDVRTQKPVGDPIPVEKPVYAVAFSPEGGKLVTGSADTTAQLWDAKTLKALGEPLSHDHTVYAAKFSPDGRFLLTGSFDKSARIWDVKTGEQIGEPLRHGDWVMSVAFSPDGRVAMTGSADRTARFWTLREGKELKQEGKTLTAVFSPQSDHVVTGSDAGVARLWQTATAAPVGELMKLDAKVPAVAVSPDGEEILTGSEDRRLRRWNAQTGDPIEQGWEVGGAVRKIHFCADRKTVLIRYASETGDAVQLWDLRTGGAASDPVTFDASTFDPFVFATSPQGRTVLIQDSKETARLWDVPAGKARNAVLRHTGQLVDAAFSSDGRTVVTGGRDQHVRLWDAGTGNSIGLPMRHGGIVRAVAFGPNHTMILSGGSDQTAQIWDAKTGTRLGQPLQHSSEISSGAISPDGRIALTICSDQSAFLWDIASSKRLARPMQYEAAVIDGAFSADGSTILFQCDDGVARLYPVPQPLAEDSTLIRAWARTRSGLQLDDKGMLQHLSQAEWLEAQRELAAIQNRK